MKKLLFLSSICLLSHWVIAQTNITCQAYYMSTPNRNLPSVGVLARAPSGATLGACNTGSGGSCVISGTSALLTATFEFTNGYVVKKRLTAGDTIIRAAFDESYVRESPTIVKEIEDAPSSSYPDGFVQTGNYVYYRAFTPSDGFQVRRYNVLTNVQETVSLPSSIEIGKVSKIWLAGSRILVYADEQFYVITNPTTATPVMSSALAGVPFWPNAEKSVLVGSNYLYFRYSEGVAELEISTGTFTTIPININAGADHFIYHAGTNYIYFTAANSSGQDRQLWRVFYGGYTPTEISSLNSPAPGGAEITSIVEWNGRLYFSAATPALGRELYRTNSAGTGIELFLDIVTGLTSSNVMSLTPAVSAALGQNELYAETHQFGLVRISTAGVVNQVVDATTGDEIRALDILTYTPSRGVLFCRNGSASKVYEHIYGNINATNLTASNNMDLYYDYNGLEMLPFSNGILFKGKKLNNNDTYLGQIFYVPFTFLGTTTWTRFVTTIRTFPNTLLPSLFNQSKLANLTQVGSRVYFSALGDASRGFEPWYYDGSAMPTTIEMPQVNTQPLGITNWTDMESVSYGNYFYYNAENISESGLRNQGLVGFQESIQKTIGTQNAENFSRLSVFHDVTSLKMAGSRMFATEVNPSNSYIESTDLTNTAYTPPVTADITTLSNTSAIGNTLYFLSLPRAAGSSFRRLWRTDGTTAGTYAIDTENTTITGTYAWNGGIFYGKNNGGGGGGLFRYDPNTNTSSTISTGGIFVSEFIEFAGALFYRASTGSAFGSLKRTDGSSSSNVVVAAYAYEDIHIKLIGNRLVVAVKSSITANWEIKSTTDGVNFVSHFASITPNFIMIGGANGILLGTVTTASPFLTAYNLNNNTSTTLGIGAFYKINIYPAIDDTNPASPIFYLAMAPTSTSGYYLYRTTLTTSGASTLTAIGASWVKVINRSSTPWQTLHRVGKKIFFLGQDTHSGIEMWVYNPDRCTNALTLASYDEDRFNSPYNQEESKRDIHYLTNTTITATNKITNATVLYRAGQSVTFLPGFQAGTSASAMFVPAGTGVFEAQIGGCGTLVPR